MGERGNDKFFFQQVADQPAITNARRVCGLDELEVYGTILGRNAGLKIWKDAWVLPNTDISDKTVCVHWEARRPGEIQIDVEPYPYEGSIGKDVLKLQRYRRQLDRKGALLAAVRTWIGGNAEWQATLGAKTNGLRNPVSTSALCAVKFIDSDADAKPYEVCEVYLAGARDGYTSSR